MTREELIEVMARALCLTATDTHTGWEHYKPEAVEVFAAIEAAGVRLVPVAWTDDDQTGLNAAVYDAMWHWEDRPIDVDDAMSLASALKASISDNGLMIVSAALKETGQ